MNKLADQKQKLKDLDAEDNELVKKIEDTAKQLREKERELVKIEEDHRNRIAQLIRFVIFFVTFPCQKLNRLRLAVRLVKNSAVYQSKRIRIGSI